VDQQDRKKQEEIAAVEPHKSPFDTFGVAIFLVVVVQLVVMVGLNIYQKGRYQNLTDQLVAHQTTLASAENATLNTQLEEVLAGQTLLQSSLAEKVKWAQFYTLLNAVTPKNVRVTSAQVSTNGSYRIDGQTPTMTTLAQLLVAWQKGTEAAPTPFSTVELASNSFGTEGGNRTVNFSITGTINLGRLQ
jgi:cytochrome c-type biogenesis protein CcmH/NrfG